MAYVSVFGWDWSDYFGQEAIEVSEDRLKLDDECKRIALRLLDRAGKRESVRDVHILVHAEYAEDVEELRRQAKERWEQGGPDIINYPHGRRIRNQRAIGEQ